MIPALALALAWPRLEAAGAGDADAAVGGEPMARRAIVFPRDHGAHPDTRTEWWYLTGFEGTVDEPTRGFQVTFFRHRTALAQDSASRFAARQLLLAHAAVTDLGAAAHRHAELIARWNGDPQAPYAAASLADADVRIGHWRLHHAAGGWTAQIDDPALQLRLHRTQPPLLQGDAGWSRKGPQPTQASYYISEPQLALRDRPGRGWLDHEWSDDILAPQAVGWDWIGMNLGSGDALTAFRLRRADGSAFWAGGSYRKAGGTTRAFAPTEVSFEPGRRWRSKATGASYPVAWRITTPAGVFEVEALLDGQELAARGSTGSVYWEGLSALRREGGERVGLGYLEMTGYAGRLVL